MIQCYLSYEDGTLTFHRIGHFWCEGFNKLLTSDSLSDICLKIYFTDQYTEAEFIILNAALLRVFCFVYEVGCAI